MAGFLGNTCRCSTAHAQKVPHVYIVESWIKFPAVVWSLSTRIGLRIRDLSRFFAPIVSVCVDHECWWYTHRTAPKSAPSSRFPSEDLLPAGLRRAKVEVSHRGQKLRNTEAANQEGWVTRGTLETILKDHSHVMGMVWTKDTSCKWLQKLLTCRRVPKLLSLFKISPRLFLYS